MVLRLCKTALVASIGIYLTLVVFNNLTDYGSNFPFVAHVLSMDTTFEGNQARWRALPHPVLHHAFYAVIIAWEFAAAALCLAGAVRLWRARTAPSPRFEASKGLATIGLTLSLLLWLLAFLAIGGEWFLMWQSRIWNGQATAARLFTVTGIVLLLLIQRDEDAPPAPRP